MRSTAFQFHQELKYPPIVATAIYLSSASDCNPMTILAREKVIITCGGFTLWPVFDKFAGSPPPLDYESDVD
jgi:hypothetical protein